LKIKEVLDHTNGAAVCENLGYDRKSTE